MFLSPLNVLTFLMDRDSLASGVLGYLTPQLIIKDEEHRVCDFEVNKVASGRGDASASCGIRSET